MNLPDIKDLTSEEARDLAIDWQNWQSDQTMYISEAIDYQNYFEAVVKKFPELKEEFKENAII